MYTLVKEPKYASMIENRSLSLFPKFTINSYLKSDYQKQMEQAVSDQFPLGETIKAKMNKYTSFVDYTKMFKNICQGNYVKVVDNKYIYDCDSRIVYSPVVYSEEMEEMFKKEINDLNKKIGDKAELYYYFINDSNNFNFKTNKSVYNFDKLLKDTNYATLDFKNYKEFSKYFYKTDHHWNYNGSYKGYSDIVKLMFGDDEEVLVPEKLINFKTNFNGSMARETKILTFYENFKAYDFIFPNHNEFLNHTKGNYGNYSDYVKGKISNDAIVNHYGTFYGGDFGEIMFDFYNNEDKENLLIVSNSFSNSINKLIASHFHKTYVIDNRYYSKNFGEKFDYDNYLKTYDIDKILIISNYFLFEGYQLGI